MLKKSLRAIISIALMSAAVSSHAEISNVVSDGDLHILAGSAAGFASISAALLVDDDTHIGILVATGAVSALAAGIGKEVADLMGYGTPELRDVINTLIGGVVAAAAILYADCTLQNSDGSRDSNLAIAFFTSSAVLTTALLQALRSERKG